jgi:hypothetical protein
MVVPVTSFTLVSLVSLAFLASLGACSDSASSGECQSDYVETNLQGSLPDVQVPASEAKQLYVCFGQVCGAEVLSRLTLTFNPALPAASFGTDSGVAPTPRALTVKYALDSTPGYAPTTGDVLRLRYPNDPQGPWSFDLSLRAEVTPADRCTPAHGTLTRVP